MDQPMWRIAMMLERFDLDGLFAAYLKRDPKDGDTVSPSESRSAWITANCSRGSIVYEAVKRR